MKERGIFTVGQLRAALQDLPDEMEVVVRAEDSDGNSFCGGILSAAREAHHHDEPDFFAIDCSDDPADLGIPLTLEAAVESLCSWAYTDVLVELDKRKLRQCLVGDIGATGTALMSEAECVLFVCGDQDDPALPALKARFPKTDAYLEEQLT